MGCLMVGIGQLICLQTLPFFVVNRDKGCQLLELENLSNLRGKLIISGLENVVNMEEAKRADLSKKSSIQSLELHWGDQKRENYSDEEVLEGLEPHWNLKGLSIENFGGKILASWMKVKAYPILPLKYLIQIRLMNCGNCEVLPALGLLPCLKFVEICGMDSVKSIDSEFYGLANYEGESSNIDGSGGARTVFPALKKLIVRDMESLVKWLEAASPLSAGLVFPCLEELVIERCPQLIFAPSHFPSMKDLTIEGLSSCGAITEMSGKLTSLTSLRISDVSGSEVDIVLENLLGNNQSLSQVIISNCDGFTYLANSLNNLVSLQILYLYDCKNLLYLPNRLQNVVSLTTFVVRNCPNLVEIPDMCCLSLLRILIISKCEKLVKLPSDHEVYKSLDILRILSCPALNSCVSISKLVDCRSLRWLTLADCGRLTTCWPEGLQLPTTLTRLGIGGFCGEEDLDYFPFPSDNHLLRLLFSLERLELYGWSQLKSLPLQIQHLTTLSELELSDFNGLEVLPDWLGNLSSLQSLLIVDCKKLVYLPSVEAMQRLTKLDTLRVIGCPLLKERCSKGSGEEWPKIAHIPTSRWS